MRVVVCDTGPILHLQEAGGLGLLQQAGEIILPQAVDAELIALLPEWSKGRPAYLRVVAVSPDERQWMDLCQSMGLGTGEAEAVALARSVVGDVVGDVAKYVKLCFFYRGRRGAHNLSELAADSRGAGRTDSPAQPAATAAPCAGGQPLDLRQMIQVVAGEGLQLHLQGDPPAPDGNRSAGGRFWRPGGTVGAGISA